MKKHLFLFFSIVFFVCQAQNDSINKLDEVVVNANKRKLIKNSKAYKVATISDSIIVNNLESFTSLLRFNAPIYFKEYGQGGTSSASFRGTSASNTAVMWNGININSINNGQTGFNSITVGLYDAIDIRSGGGSIEYGSGAIGGTIHLEDNLQFSLKDKWQNQLVGSIGSFTTLNTLYKLKHSSKKHAFNFGASYNSSDNDYPFLNSKYRNTNGAYKNYTISFSSAYKLSKYLSLNFFTTNYFGDRLFAGTLPNPTSANTGYNDINQRNLLSLKYQKNKLAITTKLAYLFQEYRYFANKNNDSYSFGNSNRYFTDVEVEYKLLDNTSLTSNTRYESTFGKTDKIKEHNRKEFSQAFIFKQNLKGVFLYDIKVRKDFNSDYNVPLSYAFGIRLKPINSLFFRANTSKNYRVPTYNDLYWPNQGNENLVPESSLQGEFGIGYQSKKLFFDVAYFTIYADDKIVWTPNGDSKRPGVWVPVNLEKTKNSGIEFSAKTKHQLFNNFLATTSLNYVYTLAKNEKIDKFLPFVPKHLFNANVGLNYKRLHLFFQQLYNGKIYTTISNSKNYVLEHFYVSNIGVNYNLVKRDKQNMTIGFKLNNVFNKEYVVLQNRPMPGINYNFNINYKF